MMVLALLLILTALATGYFGWPVVQTLRRGLPVRAYQQAVLRTREGGLREVNGPAWLSRREQDFYLHGIYDVTDRRLAVLVEPVYARMPPGSDPNGPAQQRFFCEITVVYRLEHMIDVLRFGQDLENWLSSQVRAAVKLKALEEYWNPAAGPAVYVEAVRDRLGALEHGHGIRILQVYSDGLGTRTALHLESLAKGAVARNLGREGLVLTYLETLQQLAASPATKILVPMELAGDPDAVLRNAHHAG